MTLEEQLEFERQQQALGPSLPATSTFGAGSAAPGPATMLPELPIALYGAPTDPAAAQALGGSYHALAPEVLNKMWR